jgi:hypothetical protein
MNTMPLSSNGFDKPTLGEIYRLVKEIKAELKEIKELNEKAHTRIEALEICGRERQVRIDTMEKELSRTSTRTWAVVLMLISSLIALGLKFLLHI